MTPIDLPLMILNPSAFGVAEQTPLGWGNKNNKIKVKKNSDSSSDYKNYTYNTTNGLMQYNGKTYAGYNLYF